MGIPLVPLDINGDMLRDMTWVDSRFGKASIDGSLVTDSKSCGKKVSIIGPRNSSSMRRITLSVPRSEDCKGIGDVKWLCSR